MYECIIAYFSTKQNHNQDTTPENSNIPYMRDIPYNYIRLAVCTGEMETENDKGKGQMFLQDVIYFRYFGRKDRLNSKI